MVFLSPFTRRANSINPLYASTLPLEEKIAACEGLYFRQGVSACYKMTPESQPAGLDAALAARGYALDAPTGVQVADLRGNFAADCADAAVSAAAGDAWRKAFARISGLAPERRAAHEQILAAILTPNCLRRDRGGRADRMRGVGGAAKRLPGIVRYRHGPGLPPPGIRQTAGGALMGWARNQSGHTAYLQVMLNNAPALQLYAGLGFREVYQYWYRVKARPEVA